MKKAVIYARFSSHSQNEQTIETQVDICTNYANSHDMKIANIYADMAFTGTNDQRPQFQKMLRDSGSGQFSVVLVYTLDRFGRQALQAINNQAHLTQNGVRLISATEPFGDDPTGQFIQFIMMGQAQFYSQSLSLKIIDGMNKSAQKGQVIGGHNILGYKTVDKKYVVDPETAPIVQMIFDMYIDGNTMVDIIHELNLRGVKTSRGNTFNKNSIRHILSNEKYIGIYRYKGELTDASIEPIIDEQTFKQAQRVLEKNRKAPGRSKIIGEEYILTTKMFCGHCKEGMTGVSGTSRNGNFYQYYACNNSKKHKCDKKRIRKDVVEFAVVRKIINILTPENIKIIAESTVKYFDKQKDSSEVKTLKKQLRDNKKAVENLISAIEKGTPVDIINPQIEKRRAEEKYLNDKIFETEIMYPSITVPQVMFFLNGFKDGDINDFKYRKAVIDLFVNRVYLYDDDEDFGEYGLRKNKMTLLLNTMQQSHSDIALDDVDIDNIGGSSKGRLVEMIGIEPTTS